MLNPLTYWEINSASLFPTALSSASVGAAWAPRQCCLPGPLQSPVQPLRCSPACHHEESRCLLQRLSSGIKSPRIFQNLRARPGPSPRLLSWGRSRASCNAMPLHKLVPMGVWPQRFLTLSPCPWQRSPCTPVSHWERAISPAREPYSQRYHWWRVTNLILLYYSCLNKNVFSQLWSFSCVY